MKSKSYFRDTFLGSSLKEAKAGKMARAYVTTVVSFKIHF